MRAAGTTSRVPLLDVLAVVAPVKAFTSVCVLLPPSCDIEIVPSDPLANAMLMRPAGVSDTFNALEPLKVPFRAISACSAATISVPVAFVLSL